MLFKALRIIYNTRSVNIKYYNKHINLFGNSKYSTSSLPNTGT